MRDVHGAAGDAWLATLPARLAEIAVRWSLTLGPPFAPLTYNYVAPARRADGMAVVLKAGVPGTEIAREGAALRAMDGAAARLLDVDAGRGALLLERVMPGKPLSCLFDAGRDEEATRFAAGVMRRLTQKPAAPDLAARFPSVADWAAGLRQLRARYDGGTGPLPQRLVERAEGIFRDLLAAPLGPPVLLHGDLHHDNILEGEAGTWRAIDPKGVLGEAAYEVGALLRNPAGRLAPSDLRPVLARRVAILSEELNVDAERLRAWGLAQAILSAWWTVEDHGSGGEETIAVAEALS